QPAWCAAYGSPNCMTNGALLIFSQKFDVHMGHRISDSSSDTFYYFGGFQGSFQLFGNMWNWDANYVFARNVYDAALINVQNTVKVQEALSQYCGTALDPTCVPLNYFGTGQGITKTQRDFINTSINNQAG